MLIQSALSLEAARWFDAPPRRLFDAWMHESWGEWLAPGAAWCTSSIVSPKPRGRYSVTMRMPDGRDAIVSGTYREIARPFRLVLTWRAHHDNEDTLVTIAFHPGRDGTEMTLRQDGFLNPEARDRHRHGWTGRNGVFDKLARFLADGGSTGVPDTFGQPPIL